MKPLYLFFSIMIAFLVFLASCNSAGEQTNSTQANQAATDPDPDSTSTLRSEPVDSQATRGIAPANARLASFDLATQLPTLFQIIQEDPAMVRELASYAENVILQRNIESEEEILALFDKRESSIIPHLEPFLENQSQTFLNENFEVLSRELAQLGIEMNFSEGIFTGLGPSSMLEESISLYGTEALNWYMKFLAASTRSNNGEYPFLNMKPYQDMIIAGEKLRNMRGSNYYDRIEEDFERALRTFTDIHIVHDPVTRQARHPLVHGITTDDYPYATEINTHEEFASSNESSQYKQVIQKILENPSEISTEPEQIYVVVVEWVDEEIAAQRRVSYHLNRGVDIPHQLRIIQGNGKERYAIAYRFYESDELAEEAISKIESDIPEAELILCSVKGDQLYQLGPSAN